MNEVSKLLPNALHAIHGSKGMLCHGTIHHGSIDEGIVSTRLLACTDASRSWHYSKIYGS